MIDVLLTPDISGWAIDTLCRGIANTNSQRFRFKIIPAHPRAIGECIPAIQEAIAEGVDVWHAHYWRSAEQLYALVPQLREIPRVLSHHNHNHLSKSDWAGFSWLHEWTKWGVEKLKNESAVLENRVVHIPYGIDLDRFSFIEKLEDDGKTIGYVGRVVPWKNLAEICRVAKANDFKVLGTGFVDKRDYWATVDQSNLEWHGGTGYGEATPANIKDGLYKRMTVFVMYSTEERESGTLPMLEAMARGVPVMVTAQGTARDIIEDGVNGVIFDETNFEAKLKELMADPIKREKIRQKAWETIKGFPEEKMARNFAKLYYKMMWPDHKVISVIVTSYNRAEALVDTICSIDAQDYPAKEIIVADDGSTDPAVIEAVQQCQQRIKTPIVFIKNPNKTGYDLAKMRNLAAIEALGETLLIFQDRFTLDDGMLTKIAQYSLPKQWGYGLKRVRGEIHDKNTFLEGFAWIRKADLMDAGGFNERVDRYGGLSQEIRQRFMRQGFVFNKFPDVVATQIVSSGVNKRRADIWRSKLNLFKMGDFVK